MLGTKLKEFMAKQSVLVNENLEVQMYQREIIDARAIKAVHIIRFCWFLTLIRFHICKNKTSGQENENKAQTSEKNTEALITK